MNFKFYAKPCFRFLTNLLTTHTIVLLFMGVCQAASISGVVLNDAGDVPVSNVRIDLQDVEAEVFSTVSVTTDSTGLFRFDGVASGTYGMSIAVYDPYKPVFVTAGGGGGQTVQPDSVNGITVQANDELDGFVFDIALIPYLGVLSGSVYIDEDNDGVRNTTEVGIASVEITATNEIGDEQQILTDTQGNYELILDNTFVWEISETQPIGFIDGKEALSVPAGIIGMDQYTNIVLNGLMPGYTFGELVSTVSTPTIETPVANASLSGDIETFTWQNNGVDAKNYWLYVGSSVGAFDYFNSGDRENAISVVASGLPSDGSSLVYARLWYRIGGIGPWLYVDETYIAGTGVSGGPVITSPAPSSTFMNHNGTENLVWNHTVTDSVEYWVYAGSTQGGAQYFNSGNLSSSLSASMPDMPTDGTIVWIRLWYRIGGSGPWLYIDQDYTAVDSSPIITTSSGTNVLTSPNDTLSWTDPSASVTAWWLYIGSDIGGKQYENSGNLFVANSYTTVTGSLPNGDVPVYLRLWYQRGEGSSWKFHDFVYTSAP